MKPQTRVVFEHNGYVNIRAIDQIDELELRYFRCMDMQRALSFRTECNGVMIIPYEVLCKVVMGFRDISDKEE